MARYLVLTVVFLLLGLPALPAAAVTLKEAVALALANNHEIVAGRDLLAAGNEEIAIARSHLLPSIRFEERFMRTSNPTYGFMAKLNQERFTARDFAIPALNSPRPINDFQGSITLEQPLYAPAARLGLAMSREAHAAQRREFRRTMQGVAMDTARAYLMALTAREYVAVAEKGRQDAAEHLRIAELRFKNGLGLYSDTLRAATALTKAEQQLVSARKNFAVARRSLGLLTGSGESLEVTSTGSLDLPLRDLAFYQEAARSRDDIKALEHQRNNAENGIKLARTGFLPTVGVGSSYQINDHASPFTGEGSSWQLMARLKWNLFSGNRTTHTQRKAQHQLAATREYLAGMKKAASFQVYQAYLAVKESRKIGELARAALASAEEGSRLVAIRYENSLSPMVDLLDAQVSLDQARANAVARNLEYELARIRLGYESGTILADLQLEENLEANK